MDEGNDQRGASTRIFCSRMKSNAGSESPGLPAAAWAEAASPRPDNAVRAKKAEERSGEREGRRMDGVKYSTVFVSRVTVPANYISQEKSQSGGART